MSKMTPLEHLAVSSVRNFERKEARPNAHFEETSCTIIDQANQALNWPVIAGAKEMPLEMTITGASSVKVVLEDPHFQLLNDPIFANWMFKRDGASKSSAKKFSRRSITDSAKAGRYGEEAEQEWILPERPIDLHVDGVYFRLAGFQVQETTLTLTFEDRLAAMLRAMVGRVVSHDRGKLTRAQFIVLLVREAERHFKAHVPIFCPEEKLVQQIAEPTQQQEAKDNSSSAVKTVGSNDGITVKGKPASPAQLAVINELLEVCEEEKASGKAQLALFYAAIGETECGEQAGTYQDNGAGHTGVLQGPVGEWNPHDTKGQAKAFLNGGKGFNSAKDIIKKEPKATPAQIAVEVERPSVWPDNAYAKEEGSQHFLPEAEKIFHAAGGSASGEGALGGPTVEAVYAFTRGPYENSWDCIQRLASEVSWYAFIRNNQLWYVSGDFLMAQAPGMTIERGQDGIDWIEPHIEIGAHDGVAETVVRGRASLWTVMPGGCIALANTGPASGKWVVDTIDLDILDRSDAITIKLQKPLPARPEPNAGVETLSSGEGGEGSSGERDASGTHALPLDKQYMTTLGRTDDGVDIETAPDGVHVYSMTAGVVTAVASDPSGFGPNYPVIEVTQGSRTGKYIYYGHVSKCLVKTGDKVYAGQPIAINGHTGDAASLGHGHIEIGFSDAGGNPTNHHSGGGNASTPSGEEMRAFIVWICSLFGIKVS